MSRAPAANNGITCKKMAVIKASLTSSKSALMRPNTHTVVPAESNTAGRRTKTSVAPPSAVDKAMR
jgi:hypothetical protein